MTSLLQHEPTSFAMLGQDLLTNPDIILSQERCKLISLSTVIKSIPGIIDLMTGPALHDVVMNFYVIIFPELTVLLLACTHVDM